MSQSHSLDGSALTWVLDHFLRYSGQYDIPLPTMHMINRNQSKHSLTGNRSPETAFSPRNSSSTTTSRSSQDTSSDGASDIRSALMQQVSRLPSQPCSLPPSFLSSFLRKCFGPDLDKVDFPQALHALDYLKMLDKRLQKEMTSALERLNVGREYAIEPGHSELALRYPGVAAWLETLKAKTGRIQALYTQIYLGLRRWVSAFYGNGPSTRLTSLFRPSLMRCFWSPKTRPTTLPCLILSSLPKPGPHHLPHPS